eukprot:scaffold952_cov409-Prasinococcus_capsulatus_cf.AAC.33
MVTEWLSRVYGVEEVDVSRKAVAAGLLAILSVNIVIGCYIAYAVFVAGCAEKCGWRGQAATQAPSTQERKQK